MADDFQLVSTIMDVDTVPRTMRRVRLNRIPGRQFGLVIRSQEVRRYISDTGTYESYQQFFVKRLLKDGIAACSGLLAVDDEIIEVNGIVVDGKNLDQVTDMMVANLSNLIITIQPVRQDMCLSKSPKPNTPSAALPPPPSNNNHTTSTLPRNENDRASSKKPASLSSQRASQRSDRVVFNDGYVGGGPPIRSPGSRSSNHRSSSTRIASTNHQSPHQQPQPPHSSASTIRSSGSRRDGRDSITRNRHQHYNDNASVYDTDIVQHQDEDEDDLSTGLITL